MKGNTPIMEPNTKPVKELIKLCKKNLEIKSLIDEALQSVKPEPDGSPNPWKGKTFDDLCTFFNEWYYFLPLATNGLEYIEKFGMLYYENPAGQKFIKNEKVVKWLKEFVVERAKYLDSKDSVYIIRDWIKDPRTHMEDFIEPPDFFQSFNEFFIRKIKPGARPICSPTDDSVIVSPADALLNIINAELTTDTKIHVKGQMYLNVKELLDNSQFAEKFIGGTALSCILLPAVYHHYHAPVSGMMMESREISGLDFGMGNFPNFVHGGNVGYNADFSIFEQFHRGYFIINTGEYGYVGMVPVGLNTVSDVEFDYDTSSLKVHDQYKDVTPDNPVPVYKGDELGYFAYGGSLVILLFEPGRFSAIKVLQGQQVGFFNR